MDELFNIERREVYQVDESESKKKKCASVVCIYISSVGFAFLYTCLRFLWNLIMLMCGMNAVNMVDS